MTKNLAIFLLLVSFSSTAQITLLETTEANIVSYHPGHQYLLGHAARSFHNTLIFQKALWGYTPSEKISVFIEDFGDFGNGGATSVPRNFISFGISPFSYAYETSPAGERVFATLNHEMVHVAALDNSTKRDRFFQSVFGGKVQPTSEHPVSLLYAYLTTPRYYAPRWYHEGIAAYMETWMSGGTGLALGNWDEMSFRAKVADNDRIYSAKGLSAAGTTTDFQGMSNAYLYGTRFMGYLAYKYGPDKVIDWVKRDESSKANYAGQFKQVFGLKIQDGWKDWIAFEEEFQHKNIETVSANPVTEFTPLTEGTVGAASYPFYDKKRNKIYMAVSYPGEISHIAALNLATLEVEKLAEINSGALFYVTSLAFDEKNDRLIYTEDNYTWRDIFAYDLKTKKKEQIYQNIRTGDLAVNPQDASIWGVRHSEGLSTLIRIGNEPIENPNAPPWSQMITMPYGNDLYDIDISPDGTKLSAAASNYNGNHYLLMYDVESLIDDQIPLKVDTIFDFEVSSPQSFRFSDDGNYLFGSSYYSGVSNIFRVNVNDYSQIDAISNTVSGLFRPVQINDSTLFVLDFKSDGFQPGTIPLKVVEDVSAIEYLGNLTFEAHPELADWELQIPSEDDFPKEEIVIGEKEYKPGDYLKLNNAYPTVFGYRDHIGIGYSFNFRDLFGLNEMNIQAGFSPKSWKNGIYREAADTTQLDDSEQYHFSFEYKKTKLPNSTMTFYGNYNLTSFYDLLGPTKVSRKGASAGVTLEKNLLNHSIKKLDWMSDLSGFYGLNRSPNFQTIEVSGFDNNFFLNFFNRLSYSNLIASMGAVDYEKGISGSLGVQLTYSAGNLYPAVNASLNLGVPFLFKHSSVWWRNFIGTSFSDVFNPFTRFGFAAFGNNFLDFRSSKQYRNTFALPGLRYDAAERVVSKTYFKSMGEWSLPPLRFRKLGSYNFYVNWIQPSLFTTVLLSEGQQNSDSFIDQTYGNVGIQIDARMVILSQQSATLSFGYARAKNLDGNTTFDEWMISLKLLKK